jgi:uracil phosphoribosyltransferase
MSNLPTERAVALVSEWEDDMRGCRPEVAQGELIRRIATMLSTEASERLAEERNRCEKIVQMARAGEIDADFRCIISIIRGGETLEEIRRGLEMGE